MTTTVQAGPGTATTLLFGLGANAAEALARQILSPQILGGPAGLDQTLERLPQATCQAAVREAAGAAAGAMRVSPGIPLLPAGDYPPGPPAARRYSERMS